VEHAVLALVFVQQRTARVERPLTYAVPGELELAVGDVVRVPLGPRELYGYIVSNPHPGPIKDGTRSIIERVEGPRAFDAHALSLARWMAERYCCSLGEALAAVIFAAAVPKTVDRFEVAPSIDARAFRGVPPRLLALLRDDFASGFSLEGLLRHPEARRSGDRRALLAAVSALQRGGAIVRRRTTVAARVAPLLEKFLHATGNDVRGPRVRALTALVGSEGSLRRSDALLAGFSHAIVARAIREGGLVETAERAVHPRARSGFDDQNFAATAEQQAAIDAITSQLEARAFGELLVHGITGSGKTFVYLRAIERALALGRRAIVLVPEISLTPQTARRFETVFGDRVAVIHSGLSERERFESWDAAARGAIDVVVGARSALFAPLGDVGLVVVDEAHERTYKQESVPRYDALAVAREKMKLARGTLVLGSATPPLESYAAALEGRIAYVRLDRRATDQALPAVRVVDLTAEFAAGNRRIFSSALVEGIAQRLECGEKTVLFVNRRGTASFILCRACGNVPTCVRCSVSLVAHRSEGLLRCHLCDAQEPIPATCPACGGGPIREFGAGTQKVVEAAQALYPKARIVRMDADTTTRVGDHARLLDEFAAHGDILVGTQMVAKGLDFPTVTLVGVVAADIGLHVPDFRASERTFGLITQVAGRSGRARPGEAIVQTYSPNHPAVVFAARHDYDGFAAQELAQRRELRYPPFAEITYLGIIGREEREVASAAEHYAELMRRVPGAEVLGPAPFPVPRVNDEWRYRIAVKTDDGRAVRREIREHLQGVAAAAATTRLVVNVDP
jgi:primosomal protein N' (replication factor Y)